MCVADLVKEHFQLIEAPMDISHDNESAVYGHPAQVNDFVYTVRKCVACVVTNVQEAEGDGNRPWGVRCGLCVGG